MLQNKHVSLPDEIDESKASSWSKTCEWSMTEDKGAKWHNIEMYGVTWILSGANYRFINNNMRARDANTVQIQLQLLPIQKQIILFTFNTCLGLVLYGIILTILPHFILLR